MGATLWSTSFLVQYKVLYNFIKSSIFDYYDGMTYTVDVLKEGKLNDRN